MRRQTDRFRSYANAIMLDLAATLDDLREAVNTLEETERIVRRVFGCAHPLTSAIERDLRNARELCWMSEEVENA